MAIIRALYLAVLAFFSQIFVFGAEVSVTSFLIPSILMGIGVAIDVFIATTVKFNDSTLSWKNWTLLVTVTHTLFPAVGYFLFWSTSSNFPTIKTTLGVIGFSLVSLFVYEVICESMGIEPKFGISNWISQKFGFSNSSAHVFITVLAVSWDALWSGPAKAAQAVAGNWSTTEVLVSFVIAGLVVAIMAELALFTTSLLRKRQFSNTLSLARFNLAGKYVELSVIGGFGVLSLWHAFSPHANLYESIIISALLLLVTFITVRSKLWTNEVAEIEEMV